MDTKPLTRTSALLLLAATMSACGGAGTGTQPPTPPSTNAPSAAPVAQPTVLPTTSSAPETEVPATSAPPLLSGDAATNPACALATVDEIEELAGANVKEIGGLTAPGAYSETGLTCTWFLDSEAVGIPNFSINWEFPVTSWHDPVVGLYQQIIKDGLATEIEGLGDIAILQGRYAEAIEGQNIVRIGVLQQPDVNAADQEDAMELLQRILVRVKAS